MGLAVGWDYTHFSSITNWDQKQALIRINYCCGADQQANWSFKTRTSPLFPGRQLINVSKYIIFCVMLEKGVRHSHFCPEVSEHLCDVVAQQRITPVTVQLANMVQNGGNSCNQKPLMATLHSNALSTPLICGSIAMPLGKPNMDYGIARLAIRETCMCRELH